jgi:murein DD-endopeptidase MepM/ murein hydrolase activator NlpD
MIGNLIQRGAFRLPDFRPVVQPFAAATGMVNAGMVNVGRKHALLASAAGIAIIAVAFAAVGYVHHARNVGEAQVTANRVASANIDLQDELARLRDQMAASNRDLAAAQSRVVALTEEMHARTQAEPAPAPTAAATQPAKGDKTAQLSQALHVAEAQRATLAARLSKAETDLAAQQAKQSDLTGQIDQWQKKLEELSTDRDRLKARVGELEKQSALRHAQPSVAQAQPAIAPAAATVMAAPAQQPAAEAPQRVAGVLSTPQPAVTPVPAPAPTVASAPAVATVPVLPSLPMVERAPTVVVAHGAVDQFARVLASAGVDVRHLFDQFGVNRDEGGPFIPAPRGQVPVDTLTPEKLAALRAMVKVLPVSAPLTSYRITSPFGVRADPENDRAGFHTGLDMAAPYDSPVYATAPGVVTFAGYRDDYGKIVEIDHGNGIATRYAHLHAFTVSVGEHVGVHQQIGYLGSTGRATGPHVHYEVVVNGEPQDPEKFLGLSRYVTPTTVPVAERN